jgi:hypothetical protein
MEKLPSLSVWVPVLDPLAMMFALGTGLPKSSTTLPLMVRFCASKVNGIRNNTVKNNKSFFI